MVLGKNEFYQRDAQDIQLSDPPAVFRNPERNNGRGTQSSFSYMVDHPDEIRVFHFSANQKPSMILIDEMTSVEGWLKMEEHLTAHSQFMMKEHGARNEKLKDHPDWINKIDRLMRDAHVEWLEAWKRRYVNVVNYVFKTAYSKMMRKIKYEGEHLRCPSCGEKWHASETEKNSNLIRDHLMFNCDKMAAKIKIPVKHQTNLTTFFFPPCGVQVESKMLYLAEVFKYYDVMDKSRRVHLIDLPLNPSEDPEIRLPLYMIPKHILATTEDIGVDAATVKANKKETEKIMERKYLRAMDTIQKKDQDVFCWRKDSGRKEQWKQTLTTVKEAGLWLIKYDESIAATAKSKTRGGAAASSSSGHSMMTPTAKEPATKAPPGGVPAPPPRPRGRRPEPAPKSMPTTTVPRPPLPPPPPPSRR